MNLNFWLERPPFAIKGLLHELKNGGTDITVFLKGGSVSSRKNLDSSIDADFNYVCFESFEELKNKIKTIRSGINIVDGFNSFALPFLNYIKKMEPTVVGCMTEKVSPLGKLKVVKSLLAKIKYRFIILKVQKNIDFLLPIGNEALLYFEKLGWRKESHSIFYIPDLKFDASNLHEESGNEFYCYIGRNDYDGKGLNLPVSYFKKHPDKKLLIIGDYGKKTKKVTEIIKKHKNIHRVDSIEPDEIICFCKTNKVKCIVVPSKSDGWNPNVYISMLGLIPCLCSTKTGNSSLVSDYGAGVVFKPNKKSFDKAMRTFDAMDSDDIKKIQSNEKMFILENSPKEHSQKLLVFLESVTKKL